MNIKHHYVALIVIQFWQNLFIYLFEAFGTNMDPSRSGKGNSSTRNMNILKEPRKRKKMVLVFLG